MNDPINTQALPTDPADAPLQSGAQNAGQTDSNPLDVLEQLLKNAQGKKASQGMPDLTGSPAPAEPAIDPATVQAAAQADYERIKAEHDIVDQEQLEVQKRIMENLVHTPQYQARIEQDEEKKTQQQEKAQDQDGYQIEQLVHTKI